MIASHVTVFYDAVVMLPEQWMSCFWMMRSLCASTGWFVLVGFWYVIASDDCVSFQGCLWCGGNAARTVDVMLLDDGVITCLNMLSWYSGPGKWLCATGQSYTRGSLPWLSDALVCWRFCGWPWCGLGLVSGWMFAVWIILYVEGVWVVCALSRQNQTIIYIYGWAWMN